MNSELFSVFDQAAERFIEVFGCPTVAFALREFEAACRKEGGQFWKFPEDYALYHIGTFDMVSGEIVPLTGRKVAMASNYANLGDLNTGGHEPPEER